MNKEYTILWIDDEYELMMNDIGIAAENNNIILEGFTSFEEGFEHLQKNIHRYDGVLLDGMFFESKEQSGNSEDEKALGLAINKLNELKHQKVFPWFVLSGKTSFTKEESPLLYVNDKRCFVKGNREDRKALFKAIKEEADNLEDTQIRHKYQQVFDVCCDEYINSDITPTLINILKYIEEKQFNESYDEYFNQIRKIIEELFKAFSKHGLLPSTFVENSVSLNPVSKFLSRHPDPQMGYMINEGSRLSRTVSECLKYVLYVCQSKSHSDPDNRQTPFLLYGVSYQLLDILVWFKKHIDSEPKKGDWTNTTNTSDDNWVAGDITRIAPNGWGQFLPLSGGHEIGIHVKCMEGISAGDRVEINGIPKEKPIYVGEIRHQI